MDRSSGAGGAPPRPSAPSSRPPRSRTTAGSSSTSSSSGACLTAGRVGRPHGLDGSFHVAAPDPELLRKGAVVHAAGAPRAIERLAGTAEKPIVRLEGVGRREDAEALRGELLTVPVEAAPGLEEGEFWAHEIAGCAVTDGDRAVGFVRRMVALPSCEALEVDRPDGGELLIPLVRDAVRTVDIDGRRVDVDLEFLGEA